MRVRYLPFISLLGLALGGGCIDDQGSVFIEHVKVVDFNTCTVDEAAQQQFQGLLDIGGLPDEANEYTGPVLVTTNLPPTVNTTTIGEQRAKSPNYPNYGPADSNVIIFHSAEVYFTDENNEVISIQGITPDTRRETAIGGSVYNVQTQIGEQALLAVPLITSVEARSLQILDNPDLAALEELAALANDPANRFRLISHVRVKGRTTGGAEVVSQEFSYPIELCQRCLAKVGVPAGQAECPAGQTLVPDINAGCLPGQDAPTSHCQ